MGLYGAYSACQMGRVLLHAMPPLHATTACHLCMPPLLATSACHVCRYDARRTGKLSRAVIKKALTEFDIVKPSLTPVQVGYRRVGYRHVGTRRVGLGEWDLGGI